MRTAEQWANDLSQPSIQNQLGLAMMEDDSPKILTVGSKVYKIRRMRAKAQSVITKLMLVRKVLSPESNPKEVIEAMGKYNKVPYKVAAAGILNNWAFLIWLPFVHSIYAWYLSVIHDQKEIRQIVEACVDSLSTGDFFLSIIKIESVLDTNRMMTETEVGALYQGIKSVQKST